MMQESETPRDYLRTLMLVQIREQKRKLETLEDLWKLTDCEYLLQPVAKWKKEIQKVDDARGDVTAVLNKYLTDDYPGDDYELDRIYNRGNAHADFRMKHPTEDHLIGITSTSPRIVLQSLDTGELIFPLRDKLLENKMDDKIPATKKARQPTAWLHLVTRERPEFEAAPGEVGATVETAGKFIFKAEGEGCIGVVKDDYVEFFLFFDPPYQKLSGRWGFQKLAGRPVDEKVPAEWLMLNKVYLSPEGYLLTHPDREEVEEKAKKEGLKEMIFNPQVIRMLLDHPIAKKWFRGIPRERIDRILKTYEAKGGRWKA